MPTRTNDHRVGSLAAGHVTQILHFAGAAVTHVGGDADYGIDLHVQMPQTLELKKKWSMAPKYVHVQVKGRTATKAVRVDQNTIDTWRGSTVPTVVIVCRAENWSTKSPRDIEICYPWQLPTVKQGKKTTKVNSFPITEDALVESLHALSFFPNFLLDETHGGGLHEFVSNDTSSLVLRTFFAQQLLNGDSIFVEQRRDLHNALREVGLDPDDIEQPDIWIESGEGGVWDWGHKDSATAGLVGPNLACTNPPTIDSGTIKDAEILRIAQSLRASKRYAKSSGHKQLVSLEYLRHLFG